MEKRFVEDFNEEFRNEEDNEENDKRDSFIEDDESELEEETKEEESESPNFFDDNFTLQRRQKTQSTNPFLESEPIQNLEKDLQDIPSNTAGKNNEPETGQVVYNAPQYESNYNSTNYTNIQQAEKMDITGGALTNTGGREINFKKWQETSLGYPEQGRRNMQEENYSTAPGKFSEERNLPFQSRNKQRNIGWKEGY